MRAGELTFNANNTYDGATTVAEGTLSVLGSQPQSAVIVTGGKLAGSVPVAEGLSGVGDVHATSGIVAPGLNGVGVLVTRDLTLGAASTLAVTLNFDELVTLPGRVNVTGSVTLSNAVLELTIPTPVPVESHITLVANGGRLGDGRLRRR